VRSALFRSLSRVDDVDVSNCDLSVMGITGVQKLIEDFIEGFIAFCYNLVQTFALHLWRPLRNAVRLNFLARQHKGQQVTSSTALFVAATLMVVGPFWETWQAQIIISNITGARWRSYVIAALAIYVAFDLSARGTARLLFAGRRRRDRAVQLLRYGAAASVILAGIVFWLWIEAILDNAFAEMFGGRPANKILPYAIALALPVSSYPLASILAHLTRQRFRLDGRTAGGLVYLGSVVLLTAAAPAMIYAAKTSAEFAEKLSSPKSADEGASSLSVSRSACIVRGDGTVSMAIVVSNVGEKPEFVPRNFFRAEIGSTRPEASKFGTVSVRLAVVDATARNDVLLDVVQANQKKELQLVGKFDPKSLKSPIDQSDACTLDSASERGVGGMYLFDSDTAMRFIASDSE
jgi:hypothetical protein